MDRIKPNATADVSPETLQVMAQIHERWNDGLARKDADAVAALYVPDTILESPLVRHILKTEEGVVRGREKLHEFLKLVFARTPTSRHVYRTSFFTDGHTVTWEYPHTTPKGEQMDFVEVMGIRDGLIARHCVYWGWFGMKIIQEDHYWR